MTAKTKHLMETLNLSKTEALELQEADKRIDRGEKLFELPKELESGAKKARQADRKPAAYNFSKREKKNDLDKQEIIGYVVSSLTNWFKSNECCTFNACQNLTVINPEREIIFTFNERKFKITLSAPRS